MMILICSNTSATFEAQFMKKLTNTEAKLKKKRDLQKKQRVFHLREKSEIFIRLGCVGNQYLAFLITFSHVFL